MGKSNFWEKFEDLMSDIPSFIEETGQEVEDLVGNFSYQHSGSSVSKIVHNGKKIVITTKNGKTTIKVNGKEYVRKMSSS